MYEIKNVFVEIVVVDENNIEFVIIQSLNHDVYLEQILIMGL